MWLASERLCCTPIAINKWTSDERAGEVCVPTRAKSTPTTLHAYNPWCPGHRLRAVPRLQHGVRKSNK